MFLTHIDGNQLENLKYALVGEEKYVFCFCTIWSWDGLIWRVALSQSRGTMHSWWEQALRSSWRPLKALLSMKSSWTAPCLDVVEKARGPNTIRNKLFKVFSPLIYQWTHHPFLHNFYGLLRSLLVDMDTWVFPKLPTAVDATRWPRAPKAWFLTVSFAWSVLNLLVGTEWFWSWWYRVSIKRPGRNWLSAQKILGIKCLFEKFWCLIAGTWIIRWSTGEGELLSDGVWDSG